MQSRCQVCGEGGSDSKPRPPQQQEEKELQQQLVIKSIENELQQLVIKRHVGDLNCAKKPRHKSTAVEPRKTPTPIQYA